MLDGQTDGQSKNYRAPDISEAGALKMGLYNCVYKVWDYSNETYKKKYNSKNSLFHDFSSCKFG